MQTINYKNAQIAYKIRGTGTPIVFLHGFGESQAMWTDYLPFFDQYQVITIDFPGSGASEILDVSIGRLAKIVFAVLKEAGIDKCILIGHSMGGYVALAFAKLYAEKLFGYCLFHSQAYADSTEKKAGRNKAIAFVEEYGTAKYFQGLIPLLFASDFIKNKEKIINKLIHDGSSMKQIGVQIQLAAMRDRPDNQAVLSNAKVPVCFIIGKKDIAIPAGNSINQTYLPKVADIHILPKVGHMGMFEARETTVKILKNFIEFCSNT